VRVRPIIVDEAPATPSDGASSRPSLQRGRGILELGFAGGAPTRLTLLHQSDPCRALLPRPEPGEPLTAVTITTSGGLTDGDRTSIAVRAVDRAEALVTSQAAEKIYRARGGGETTIGVEVTAGAGSRLEYMPQETILFDGARLRRHTTLAVDPTATLLAGDLLVFGRKARGERLTHGKLSDHWRVRVGGRLVWADGLDLGADVARPLAAKSGFDGAVAFATLLIVAADAPRYLDEARGLRDDRADDEGAADEAVGGDAIGTADLREGATSLPGLTIVRLLGRDAGAVRRRYAHLWGELRRDVLDRPARVPRIWAC
jgi:urease accessory protein